MRRRSYVFIALLIALIGAAPLRGAGFAYRAPALLEQIATHLNLEVELVDYRPGWYSSRAITQWHIPVLGESLKLAHIIRHGPRGLPFAADTGLLGGVSIDTQLAEPESGAAQLQLDLGFGGSLEFSGEIAQLELGQQLRIEQLRVRASHRPFWQSTELQLEAAKLVVRAEVNQVLSGLKLAVASNGEWRRRNRSNFAVAIDRWIVRTDALELQLAEVGLGAELAAHSGQGSGSLRGEVARMISQQQSQGYLALRGRFNGVSLDDLLLHHAEQTLAGSANWASWLQSLGPTAKLNLNHLGFAFDHYTADGSVQITNQPPGIPPMMQAELSSSAALLQLLFEREARIMLQHSNRWGKLHELSAAEVQALAPQSAMAQLSVLTTRGLLNYSSGMYRTQIDWDQQGLRMNGRLVQTQHLGAPLR